ncbi:hypothetical protein F0U62_16520 [Cystobacter fuscus]|nr:hypothetical protein F0U62_16520 [Cystobacter fuscus]
MIASCSDFKPVEGEQAGSPPPKSALAAQALALPFPILPRQSLVITDTDIVSAFTLRDVLGQLVSQGQVPGQTPLELFHQLFDTFQRGANGNFPGPHCDDVAAVTGDIQPPVDPNSINPAFPFEKQVPTGSINGWPILCPRSVGDEAAATNDPFSDPLAANAYMATTLSNRFDLAPPDGSDCGEYRLVFARRSGIPGGGRSGFERNFIIFEARLPNPHPEQGRQACIPVVQFWLNQSDPSKSPATRASELHDFFFNGLPGGFEPVIHIDHYGARGGPHSGQVRTNEFLLGLTDPINAWSLREFRLLHGTSGNPSLKFVPSFVKDNPSAKLFVPGTSADPRVTGFQDSFFLDAVNRLASTDDLNRFAYPSALPTTMEAGESLMIPLQNNYLNAFGSGGTLKTRIQNKLDALGSTLTPEQLVARAQSLSCAGCHEPVDGTASPSSELDVGLSAPYPKTLTFTHTSEQKEAIPGAPGRERFLISNALTQVFIPFRQQVMTDFLLGQPILGFEKPGAWTSAQTPLPLHTGRVTEGISSLQVAVPTGVAQIVSPSFSTAGLTPVGNKLKLDFFVSAVQPNPAWVGTVEVLISVPSAGISNQWVGNVVLNTLPRGAFSTLEFPLQAGTVTALNKVPADVKLQVDLSVTTGSGPYYLDNVRFAN